MRTHRFDFLCLTDARIVSASFARHLREAAVQLLGSGSSVEIFLTKPGHEGDFRNVGG
jgi:hypothetical protein